MIKNKIMNRIKKVLLISFCTLLMCILSSCSEEIKYPKYSLITVEFIPDSLKSEHRTWIMETVRAASQHMTGGDYEDVGMTIIQTERTADRLFQDEVIGLRKEINNNYYDDLILIPSELSDYEKIILDNLINVH
jgi:hypothetical protein